MRAYRLSPGQHSSTLSLRVLLVTHAAPPQVKSAISCMAFSYGGGLLASASSGEKTVRGLAPGAMAVQQHLVAREPGNACMRAALCNHPDGPHAADGLRAMTFPNAQPPPPPPGPPRCCGPSSFSCVADLPVAARPPPARRAPQPPQRARGHHLAVLPAGRAPNGGEGGWERGGPEFRLPSGVCEPATRRPPPATSCSVADDAADSAWVCGRARSRSHPRARMYSCMHTRRPASCT